MGIGPGALSPALSRIAATGAVQLAFAAAASSINEALGTHLAEAEVYRTAEALGRGPGPRPNPPPLAGQPRRPRHLVPAPRRPTPRRRRPPHPGLAPPPPRLHPPGSGLPPHIGAPGGQQPLNTRRYSGRPFSADELALVAAIAADHDQHPTRAAIARAVCTQPHWFQPVATRRLS